VCLTPTYSKNSILQAAYKQHRQIQDLKMFISSLLSVTHKSAFTIANALAKCASQLCCSISLPGLRFTISIIATVQLYKNALIMLFIHNCSLNIGDIVNLRLGGERWHSCYAHPMHYIIRNKVVDWRFGFEFSLIIGICHIQPQISHRSATARWHIPLVNQ
jgi:hypothetical protein